MELRKFLLFVLSITAVAGVTAQDGWRNLPKSDLFGEAREARVYDGKLYLATDKGIFVCPLQEGQNSWECVGFNGMNIVGFAKCGDRLLAVRRTVIEKTTGPREWYHHLLSSNTGSTTSTDITPSDIVHESEYGIRIMQLYDGQPEHLYLTYCNSTNDKPCTMLETNDFAQNWTKTGAYDQYAAYDGSFAVYPNSQRVLVYGMNPYADCTCPYLLETKDGFQTLNNLAFVSDHNFVFGDIACPSGINPLLAATSAGIAKSNDYGASWKIIRNDVNSWESYLYHALGFHFVTYDPSHPSVAYATYCRKTDNSYYVDVYRSDDSGDNWQVISTSPALSAKLEAAILNGSQFIMVSSGGETLCLDLDALIQSLINCGEYAPKDVVLPNTLYSVGAGAPVIATKAHSRAAMLLETFMYLKRGDVITQLTYKGYNPGKPFTRHFIVWMSNTQKTDIKDQDVMAAAETMTKVFEGDCTIPAGGSADERIPLLTIPLDQPFVFDDLRVRVVIESTGEPVEQDVCFEQNRQRLCRYATADSEGSQWSQPEQSGLPLTTLTVATPVVNLTGTVFNQDKAPIPNATIQLTDYQGGLYSYAGETDSEGNYAVRIEEGNRYFTATVSAAGCATYTGTFRAAVKYTPEWDFTLYDAVVYKAGRRATIIMPVIPDASAGRYFKMDRTEEGQVVFEREFSPQANIPYVIIPDRDFVVDLKPLDLSVEAGKTSVSGVEFVGSYINREFTIFESQKLLFLDETADVEYDYSPMDGITVVGGRIAALRACIIEDWRYGDDIVLHDETDGISPALLDTVTDSIVYDLQGRRLQGKPEKGVYIHDGKKYLVK